MLSKELASLVARVATTMTDKASPSTAEVLMALNEVAEKAEAIGYARGVVSGSRHTAQAMELVFIAAGRV